MNSIGKILNLTKNFRKDPDLDLMKLINNKYSLYSDHIEAGIKILKLSSSKMNLGIDIPISV